MSEVRTFLVFRDLPIHVEYRVGNMPIVPEKTEIVFKISLRHPVSHDRVRKVDGTYTVAKRRLIMSDKGLTQYLELDLIK